MSTEHILCAILVSSTSFVLLILLFRAPLPLISPSPYTLSSDEYLVCEPML